MLTCRQGDDRIGVLFNSTNQLSIEHEAMAIESGQADHAVLPAERIGWLYLSVQPFFIGPVTYMAGHLSGRSLSSDGQQLLEQLIRRSDHTA